MQVYNKIQNSSLMSADLRTLHHLHVKDNSQDLTMNNSVVVDGPLRGRSVRSIPSSLEFVNLRDSNQNIRRNRLMSNSLV